MPPPGGATAPTIDLCDDAIGINSRRRWSTHPNLHGTPTMPVSMRDRALLVRMFYENGRVAAAALRAFRRVNAIHSGRGPMSPHSLIRMMSRFEETGVLSVQRGRGRRPVAPQVVDDIATAVVEQSTRDSVGSSSARGVSRQLGIPYSTVWKVLRKVMRSYPYKICRYQQLLPGDTDTRMAFALATLARTDVDDTWPWNILWSDEAHFYLNGTVNTQNCRIWSTDNPHAFQEAPLHSPKVTVWCGFTSTFILGPYFFEEATPDGPVTCTVTAARYRAMLATFVVPQLRQRRCLPATTFMQDGAPPHIGRAVTEFLRRHFTDERIISRSFPTAWPPRSPDLNPCDFWLWGHLKSRVYQGHVGTLAALKDSITLHVRSIPQETLHATVEHFVHRINMVHMHNGGHIEQYG